MSNTFFRFVQYYMPMNKPTCYYYAAASDLTTRQCPYLGQYEVVFVMRAHVNGEYSAESFGPEGDEGLSQDEDNVAQVRKVRMTSTTPFPMPCHATSLSALDIGCERSDRMKFPTSCSDETLSGKFS